MFLSWNLNFDVIENLMEWRPFNSYRPSPDPTATAAAAPAGERGPGAGPGPGPCAVGSGDLPAAALAPGLRRRLLRRATEHRLLPARLGESGILSDASVRISDQLPNVKIFLHMNLLSFRGDP